MNQVRTTYPYTTLNWFQRLSLAPLYQLLLTFLVLMALGATLVLVGLAQYRTFAMITLGDLTLASPSDAPLRPADFTPLASPPPAFQEIIPEAVTPTLAEVPPTATPEGLAMAETLTDTGVLTTPLTPTATADATVTPFPIKTILEQQGQTSLLQSYRVISVLIMGTDGRPDELGPSRTDSMMVAILNLDTESVTLISIPRDLWVSIPGYSEGRINTAYFMGELWGEGPEVARQTVSQVLGIPITHTLVADFYTFRDMVDKMGGIDVVVPSDIDDPWFPDDNYGTYYLHIDAGANHFDGETALAYARTRHGSSDIERAARQQQVMEAMRTRLLTPDQLPQLPGYISDGFESVKTSLTLTDLFFLADFGMGLDRDRIFTHVIQAPLLWNGVTADGQQVLLYDPYELQTSVQQWLWESSQTTVDSE